MNKQVEGRRYTLKELMQLHEVRFVDLYEFCDDVRVEYIRMAFNSNFYTQGSLREIVKWFNKWAATTYTVEDVVVEKMF